MSGHGINGRKLNFISLDDGYSPPKTVEQSRRLVEQEQVAFLFNSLGTPTNAAIRHYCNDNKVPQLFVSTGASMFSDPEHFPWTIGFNPSYRTEARIYAKDILSTKPDVKIGVYQNDDFGQEYLIGLKDVMGPDRAGIVIKEVSYEISEPTVDSQIITLQGSGADVFVFGATPKAAAQAIRKAYDIGWTPCALHVLRLAVDRVRHEARRPGKIEGRNHGHFHEGSDRRALEGRSGHEGMAGVLREISHPNRFHRREFGKRVYSRRSACAGAHAVRKRSLARQHYEASR
jgi:hypothetical protein